MADVGSTLASWSTTASSNNPTDATTIGAGLADNLQEIQKVVRQDLAHKGSDIASAAAIDPGNQAGLLDDVTGTVTTTSLGTVSAGIWRFLKAEGAWPVTHNATNLILLGGASRTYANGDVSLFFSEGSGNWRELMFQSAQTPKQTIYVPATAMISRTTNGPASGSVETTTNKIMLRTLDFDTSTTEYAQVSVAMPKSWNEGTVTAQPIWSMATTTATAGVAWGVQALALSDDDAADTALGTAIVTTDTGGTTNDVYIAPETAAITAANSPAEGDVLVFQIYRDTGNASDTLNQDARLHGLKIIYTTNYPNDA